MFESSSHHLFTNNYIADLGSRITSEETNLFCRSAIFMLRLSVLVEFAIAAAVPAACPIPIELAVTRLDAKASDVAE